MKKFKIVSWRDDICVEEILKETAQYVVLLSGRRELKADYFDSFIDAKNKMIKRAELKLKSAKAQVEYIEQSLAKIKLLKEV